MLKKDYPILFASHNLAPVIGTMIGVLFWVFDALFDVTFFSQDASLQQSLFFPESHDLWLRSAVMLLAVIFSVYVRHLLIMQKKVTVELSYHKNNLEKIISLRTADLERLASYDELTQIYNRRKFRSLLEMEILRASRYKRDLALIVFDIDFFKNINDNYGHDIGDITLTSLANLLSSSIRNVDVFGRIGGEEFAIFLPETPLENTRVVAERLRAKIASTQICPECNVTVSMGVTRLYENDSMDSMFKRADIALYAAKSEGRNCIVFA